MEQTYQHLLSLEFQHKYFRDTRFRSLQVSYDRDTASLLQNLGIVLKPYHGGLYMLTSDVELLKSAYRTNPIRFYLECNDPYYINYTLLPTYTPNDSILYFNNLQIPTDDSTSKLHQDEFVGPRNIVPWNSGRLKINDFSSDKGYHFLDVFGNEIPLDHIRASSNNPKEFLISNIEQGMIRLFGDNEEQQRVYYSPHAVRKKPLGILELYPGRLHEHYEAQGKLEYALAFATRKTIWKYFLVDPVYQKFDNLSIVNGVKKQIFQPPRKLKVHDREALMFESTNSITLSEFSEDSFQLYSNYNEVVGNGKVVIKNLPRASADQLFQIPENSDESLYSHIYI